MKRLFGIICLTAMMILLSACSGGAKADEGLSDIYREIKAEVELPEMVELDSAEKLDRNYGITVEMVEDYAGGIDSSGVTMNEVVLIKTKDSGSAAAVKEKLTNRLNSKLNQNRSYNPEQAAVIEKCRVEEKDRYVFLIISEESEKIREIIGKHIN